MSYVEEKRNKEEGRRERGNKRDRSRVKKRGREREVDSYMDRSIKRETKNRQIKRLKVNRVRRH